MHSLCIDSLPNIKMTVKLGEQVIHACYFVRYTSSLAISLWHSFSFRLLFLVDRQCIVQNKKHENANNGCISMLPVDYSEREFLPYNFFFRLCSSFILFCLVGFYALFIAMRSRSESQICPSAPKWNARVRNKIAHVHFSWLKMLRWNVQSAWYVKRLVEGKVSEILLKMKYKLLFIKRDIYYGDNYASPKTVCLGWWNLKQ